MDARHAAFVSAIPEFYERSLGPLLFAAPAKDLAQRLTPKPRLRVLELACGTGIATEALWNRVAPDATVVATDLNEAMLDVARRRGLPPGVTWQQADATALPFPEASFDAVVCQFGWMFFPDKAKAMREAHRVLTPGGQLLVSTWDRRDKNFAIHIAATVIEDFFEKDPPTFYKVPFSMHDLDELEKLATDAGFQNVKAEPVDLVGESPSIVEAAEGFVRGNPVFGEISARAPEATDEIIGLIGDKLRERFGDKKLTTTLKIMVLSATA